MGTPSVLPATHRPTRTVSSEGSNQELESIFWSAMQLLGFPLCFSGISSGIAPQAADTGPEMFRRSNGAGLDQVLHFLLEMIEGSEALRKRLKGCWPPLDGRQRTHWRRTAKGCLDEYAGHGLIPQKLAASAASMLHTASGNRLLELLCHLSAHALRLRHLQLFPEDRCIPTPPASLPPIASQLEVLPVLLDPIRQASAARVYHEQDKFLDTCHDGKCLQASWASTGEALSAEYRDLLAQDAKLKEELEQEFSKDKEMPQAIGMLENEAIRAEEMWQDLPNILSCCSDLTANSGMALHGESHPNGIVGDDILPHKLQLQPQINVPSLVEAWDMELSTLRSHLSALALMNGQRVPLPQTPRPKHWIWGLSTGAVNLANASLAAKAHGASKEALSVLKNQLQLDIYNAEVIITCLQGKLVSAREDQAGASHIAQTRNGCVNSKLSSSEANLLATASSSHGGSTPKSSPLLLVPPSPACADIAEDVRTPLPSLWASTNTTSSAPSRSQMADPMAMIASIYKAEKAKLFGSPETMCSNKCVGASVQGCPCELSLCSPFQVHAISIPDSSQDSPSIAKNTSLPLLGGHNFVQSPTVRSMPPGYKSQDTASHPLHATEYLVPDTVERQFSAGLRGFDDRELLTDLSDIAMPLEV